MLYLVDTSPKNGCLRVIPKSHRQRVPLDVHHPGHSHWGEDVETDKALPEAVERGVAEQPGAVDVAVKAGDLVIGDSRLYHAARANASDARRTCLTMWYGKCSRSLCVFFRRSSKKAAAQWTGRPVARACARRTAGGARTTESRAGSRSRARRSWR